MMAKRSVADDSLPPDLSPEDLLRFRDGLAARVRDLRDEQDRLAAEVGPLRIELVQHGRVTQEHQEAARAAIRTLNGEATVLEQQRKTLEKDAVAAGEKLANLRDDLVRVKAEVTAIIAERKALGNVEEQIVASKRAIAAHEDEATQARAQVVSLRETEASARDRVKEITAEADRLRAEAVSDRAESERALRRTEKGERDVKALTASLKDERDRVKAKEALLQQREEDIIRVTREQGVMSRQHAEEHAQLQGVREEVAGRQAEVVELGSRAAATLRQAQVLRAEGDAQDATATARTRALDEREQAIADKQKEQEDHAERLRTAQLQLDAATSTFRRLLREKGVSPADVGISER